MDVSDDQRDLGKDPGLRRYDDVSQLIGDSAAPTPLVRLGRVVESSNGPLFLKLEWMNPFGSIKDRAAKALLDGLDERGELEGKTIVEPTSGNTGIALAALAAIAGRDLTVTVPDEIPEEKKVLLRMLGAEVWPVPDDLCPIDHPKDGAIALAHSFVESEAYADEYVMPDQYQNPDNVKAHYETTGPEIWRQTEGRVRWFFAGLGTCGTISGVGRYLKECAPDILVVGIEPQKGHRIPGMKNMEESKTPAICDHGVIDDVIRVGDHPAYAMTKRLFREEGLIVGPSTGAIVGGALRYLGGGENVASDDTIDAGVAVAVSPDGGHKYASFFEDILGDEGVPKP
jgi:cysteine synthase A/cysteine synthase B